MELSNDSCAWTSDGYGWSSQVWDVWAGGLGVQVYLGLGFSILGPCPKLNE